MSSVRLARSESDKKITGVCAGIAKYLDVDPVLVRLAFVILTFASGVGVMLYVVLTIITPSESVADEIRINPQYDDFSDAVSPADQERKRRTFFASLLVLLGAFFLMGNFGINLSYLMPILLIVVGAWLIFNRNR